MRSEEQLRRLGYHQQVPLSGLCIHQQEMGLQEASPNIEYSMYADTNNRQTYRIYRIMDARVAENKAL